MKTTITTLLISGLLSPAMNRAYAQQLMPEISNQQANAIPYNAMRDSAEKNWNAELTAKITKHRQAAQHRQRRQTIQYLQMQNAQTVMVGTNGAVTSVTPTKMVIPIALARMVNRNIDAEDYVKRVQDVHNLVCRMNPRFIIDSLADINHNLLDSIRGEMARNEDADSVIFLKAALHSGMKDSITLAKINSIVNFDKGYVPEVTTGSINTYCIDLSTQAPMSSVEVSVFSHDSLICKAVTSNDGFCRINDLKPGEYSLSFAKDNYTPYADRWIKVTSGDITYLQMPLTESARFYVPKFSAKIWVIIGIIVISVLPLIYAIIRRLERVV